MSGETDGAHTRVDYLYRDGANFKSPGSVVFRGLSTPALRERLEAALLNHGLFLPRPLGLEELAPWTRDLAELVLMDDDAWHEIQRIEPTFEAPTDGRTFEAFVEAVERVAAHGWPSGDPLERMGAEEIRHLLDLKIEAEDWTSALEVLLRVGDDLLSKITTDDATSLLAAGDPRVRAEALRLLGELDLPEKRGARAR